MQKVLLESIQEITITVSSVWVSVGNLGPLSPRQPIISIEDVQACDTNASSNTSAKATPFWAQTLDSHKRISALRENSYFLKINYTQTLVNVLAYQKLCLNS